MLYIVFDNCMKLIIIDIFGNEYYYMFMQVIIKYDLLIQLESIDNVYYIILQI